MIGRGVHSQRTTYIGKLSSYKSTNLKTEYERIYTCVTHVITSSVGYSTLQNYIVNIEMSWRLENIKISWLKRSKEVSARPYPNPKAKVNIFI